MNKPRVYVTRAIPGSGLKILAKRCELTIHNKEELPTKEDIIKNIADKDGLLCMLTDRIDSDILSSGSKLKVISSFSVGVDHISVPEATQRGIYVTYTPGILTEATADLSFALLMATARHVAEADRYIRSGKWKISWSPSMLLGVGVYGKVLGVIGLGRIGTAVAERGLGLKMKVLYYSKNRSLEKEESMGLQYMPIEELVRISDFISIHVPLNKETYHLVNRQLLSLMKKNAIIINTSRGQIIDEEALVEVLKEGRIAGAGLDVFQVEPLEKDNELLKLNNVILTPHLGSATYETRRIMSEVSAQNLISVLEGVAPHNLYNPEVMKIRSLLTVKMI